MNSKIYSDVLSGNSDYNIRYADFQKLITDLGVEFKRQKDSHTMYYHGKYQIFINIQKDGSKAKGYEVRQLREIILKYGLQE